MDRAQIPLSPLILKSLFSQDALASIQWEPFRKGIEAYWIYSVPLGPSAALLRYSPEATLARHYHPGFEHILVLHGSQTDDNGEHVAGTLIVHPPGTTHAISSARGCIVLAVWEKPVHPLQPA